MTGVQTCALPIYTPRQINILTALGAALPAYAHVPMILREDGNKMSKRRDAVSVMQYKDMGILPQALLNYLARLCWSHGNDEIFCQKDFLNWFNLEHVSGAAARFDLKKLFWVNAQHIKTTSNGDLKQLILDKWQHSNLTSEQTLIAKVNALTSIDLEAVIELVKPRADNINTLANECSYFYQPASLNTDDSSKFLTIEAQSILDKFTQALTALDNWSLDAIKQLIKEFCQTHDLKMPALGMPLRLKLCGTKETPSFDSVVHLLGREQVLQRLNN